MMAADPPTEKQRLRQAMKTLLRESTPEGAQRAGGRIAELLAADEAWQRASRIVLFSSRPDEVDTSPIWRRAGVDRKPVLLPRMTSEGSLDFALATAPDRLEAGRFGIAEPRPEAPAVRLDRGDLVLVPGLAFDRQGGRLGRGGGYYDRAFAGRRRDAMRPVLIGVGFSFQIVDHVPMTVVDVPIDGIVSERELIWMARDGEGQIP
jgi:5-formyltetrahydrofolate cyclo-ligase